MSAFFNEPKLKEAVIRRLEHHRTMDDFVQGIYFEEGRGCHLGCLTHSNNDSHVITKKLFNIPVNVAYLLESIFEGIPSDNCSWWAIESIKSIPVGADFSLFKARFCIWLLRDSTLLKITKINKKSIGDIIKLHELSLTSPISPAARSARSAESRSAWSVVESAAWSAWSADESAESAAWSAAESAAWSAARSAESAARSAESAAWSAARSAEFGGWSAGWLKIANKCLELFEELPTVASNCDKCVQETIVFLENTELVTN